MFYIRAGAVFPLYCFSKGLKASKPGCFSHDLFVFTNAFILNCISNLSNCFIAPKLGFAMLFPLSCRCNSKSLLLRYETISVLFLAHHFNSECTVFFFLQEKKVDQATSDDRIIKQYISDNNLNATATGSGLYYVISTQGTGAQPNSGSTVTVKYKVTLPTGRCLTKRGNSGASFGLGNVIKVGRKVFRFSKRW